MKSVVLLLIGAALGAVGLYFVVSPGIPEQKLVAPENVKAVAAADETKVVQGLRAQVVDLEGRLGRAVDELVTLREDRAALEAQLERAEESTVADDPRSMALQMGLAHLRQRHLRDVEELEGFLDLTDAQRADLSEVFKGRHAPAIAALEARLRGEGSGPIELQIEESDDGLASILTPEQMAEYEQFQAVQNAANLETVASASLNRLSAPLRLDETQKDAVYSAYYRYHEGMMGMAEPASPEQRRVGLETEMGNALTPEQFARWQNMDRMEEGPDGGIRMEIIAVESESPPRP